MSYRELFVFVKHLPQDSWTQTIIRDERLDDLVNPEPASESEAPKFGPWNLLNYQLTQLIDAVNWNTHMVKIAGHIKERGDMDPTPPEPTPRPGRTHSRPVRQQPEWAVAYLNKLRATG